MKRAKYYTAAAAAALALAGTAVLGAGPANAGGFPTFTGPLDNATTLASTVPANGDVNPYGVAVVPRDAGNLDAGNVLVSNFNDQGNTQGTGTTIVQVTPGGKVSQFAQIDPNLPGCPGGVGLTTALSVLRSGWVIVGSLPTQGGNVSGPGCLIVLDSHGTVRETFRGHGINGPWDMTALDLGHAAVLFVTNVLDGTVERLVVGIPEDHLPFLASTRTIGSGFPHRTDPNALVIGPTGVGLGQGGTLYVADTLSSRIAAIPGAVFRFSDDGTGRTVTEGNNLNGELGLAIAPGGDILTVNGGDGNLVETTPAGDQVAVKTIDTNNGGAGNLFGLAIKPHADAVYYVDDFDNTLRLLH